jgi:hypothetical protein
MLPIGAIQDDGWFLATPLLHLMLILKAAFGNASGGCFFDPSNSA